MKYTTLLVDIDETILDFRAAEAAALEIAVTAHDYPFSRELCEQYHAINDAIWKAYERGEIEKSEIPVKRFAELYAARGWQGDPAVMGKDFIAALSRQGQILSGAEAFLTALQADFDLYAITNGIETVQQGRFAASGIERYFCDVFISENVGFGKPDRRYFDCVLEAVGAPDTARVLVIGDSPTSDIRGAQNAGLDSLWFDRNAGPLPDGITPTYRASSYDEIIEIIKEKT